MRKVVRAFPLVALCFATAGLSRAAWAWESRDFRQRREHCGGSYGDTLNCQSSTNTNPRANTGGATTSPPARRGGTTSSYSGGARGTQRAAEALPQAPQRGTRRHYHRHLSGHRRHYHRHLSGAPAGTTTGTSAGTGGTTTGTSASTGGTTTGTSQRRPPGQDTTTGTSAGTGGTTTGTSAGTGGTTTSSARSHTTNTASSVLLPADRLVTWNPGLTSAGGIPNRTTIYKTLSPSGQDDTAAIQAALNSAPAGQVVMLSAGTFIVNNILMISRPITLRGSGAEVTKLVKTNGAKPRTSTVISGTKGILTPVDPTTYSYDSSPIIIVGASRWNNGPDNTSSQNLTADGA